MVCSDKLGWLSLGKSVSVLVGVGFFPEAHKYTSSSGNEVLTKSEHYHSLKNVLPLKYNASLVGVG